MDLKLGYNIQNQDAEKEKILSIIKSCITSAKESLTIEQLHRDYKQIVGSSIPFRKFQHGTLASFLQSVPQVIKVYISGGQLYVKAVASAETSHLENLIRGQKKSKAKGSFDKPIAMRKPRNSTWIPPSYSYRSHYGGIQRPPLLPTPLYSNQRSMGRRSAVYVQPVKKPNNFAVDGNLYIPRSNNQNEKTSSEQAAHSSDQIPKMPLISSYKEELYKEAKKKGLENIEFQQILRGKKNNFIATIKIGNQIFSSYPHERKTQQEAEEVVSKMALESLRGILKSPSLPQTKSNDLATQRIKQILAKQGDKSIWWDHVKDCYAKEYLEYIPENWIEVNKEGVAEIEFDKPTEDFWTLRLKVQKSIKQTIETGSSSVSPMLINQERSKLCQPNPLKLPEDKMWNVFISYIKDCSEICFRLVGEEYSDAYENLVTDMELHYMDEVNLKALSTLKIDEYYICNHDDLWFRIRLLSIEGDKTTVLFIDHGDTETIPSSKIFYLETKFLKLPCQSINACLAGFEYGFSDPTILSAAQNLSLGKTLVAEVLSREERISVVLYDTSTNDDININEKLLQMLPQAYPEPNFPCKDGICEVYASHVSKHGDLFVKIESASLKTLESLFFAAKKRAAEILGNENLTIDLEKLYLAKFSPDGEWCRASPRSANRDSNGKCLPCRLFNVPSTPGLLWTQRASERLVSLFPRRDEPLLLKIKKEKNEEELTMVELFKRVQPENLLVSVNATLDLDSSLFSSEDKNNNFECSDNDQTSCSTGLKDKNNKLEISQSPSIDDAFPLQELSPPPLPEVNSYFDVVVTYAANPSNFAVQSWKDSMKLEWLMGEMKSFYSNSSNRKVVGKIAQGGFYALSYNDDLWYRVRVDKVSDDLVSGIFVDYGDCFCSSTDKIQPLWPNFKQFTYQAFRAMLAGITPINKDWTPEDCFRFKKLIEDRPFVSIVTSISVGDQFEAPTLHLRLIDTTDPNIDTYIDEIFIKENRARKAN